MNFDPIKMQCNKEEEVNCQGTTIASTTDGTTVCDFKVILGEDKTLTEYFLSGNDECRDEYEYDSVQYRSDYGSDKY